MHKYNLRDELIISLMNNKGITKDPFVSATIKNRIKDIPDSKLQSFFESVAEADSFGDGLKVIMKIAEQFKPKQDENAIDLEAQRLIQLVYGMNQAVYQDHIKTGISFDVLLSGVKFPKLSSEDNSVLTNVAPHYNLRDLIQHISCYTNSIEQHRAFKTALTRVGESLAIENSRVSGMIGRMKK